MFLALELKSSAGCLADVPGLLAWSDGMSTVERTLTWTLPKSNVARCGYLSIQSRPSADGQREEKVGRKETKDY